MNTLFPHPEIDKNDKNMFLQSEDEIQSPKIETLPPNQQNNSNILNVLELRDDSHNNGPDYLRY